MGTLVFLLLLGMMQFCRGHEGFLGGCPKVDPMEDFEIEKFEGLWYVVELFEKGVKCMSWNISKENNDTWKVYEKRKSGLLHSVGLDSASVTTGKLKPKGKPGSFNVKWPLNIAGSYDLIVFHTDYNTAAGIFACQGLLIGHRQQGLILSREPFLKQRFRQIISGKLEKFRVEPYYFQKVDQTRCGYEGEVEVEDVNFGPLAVESTTEESKRDGYFGEFFGDY